MIARYSRKSTAAIWSEENRFQKWFEVELAVLRVLEKDRKIPKGTAAKISSKAKINVRRIHEIESETRHDVIAFTTSIAEQAGDAGRFFHYGLTSSDVVDTAFSLLLAEASHYILEDIKALEVTLERLAVRYKNLACIGRTHGVHAEPMSFGLKFLGWLAEFRRQRERFKHATQGIRVGKLSGAVGCYGVLSPEVERRALASLGLVPESVSTQIIPRDRHAELFQVIAGIGASVERVALELRHLQRTEVNELEEEFSAGQKGSSAMPHKKNPISAENLTGCARLLRGYSQAALENIALWHERDISHSSVERVIGPDATILLDYMLDRLNGVLKRVKVLPENVNRNLRMTKGIPLSGQILLRLVEKGSSREDAYKIVQAAAHRAWEGKRDFIDELWDLPEIQAKFSHQELAKALEFKNSLVHIDQIYDRVMRDGFERNTEKKAGKKKKK